MKASLQSLCDRFIFNRDVVKSEFRMENSYLYPVCANLFCAAGVDADRQRLAHAKQLIKDQTGLFSNFRGNIRPAVSCMLALSERPEEKMDRVLQQYQSLKQHFWGSEYLALSAYLLADLADGKETVDHAARGRALYDRMKKEHPFLTAQEDSVFAVLMAFSDKTDDALVQDMEACYGLLKQRFHSSNAVQSASHVLALAAGEPKEKAARVADLYDAIVAAGGKYGREYQLATLAALTILPVDIAAAAADIMDVDEWLSHQKGYGIWGLDRRTRTMHAAMIVADDDAPSRTVDAAAFTGTIAMVAAQQSATCAAIIASSAAASAAASSN